MNRESPSRTISVTTHPTIAGIGRETWDACACPEAAAMGVRNSCAALVTNWRSASTWVRMLDR